MHINISDSAFNDLESIQRYYDQENVPSISNRLVSEIIKHIETLSKHPEIGRVVPEFDDKKLREIIHPPFRIIYLKQQDTIHIIRIWRSERLMLPLEK